MTDLAALLAEGKAALRAPLSERVSLSLIVLPKLVDALDEIVKRHAEYHALRMALTIAVSELRREVYSGMKSDPGNTANNGRIAMRLRAVNDVLDRLIEAMANERSGQGMGAVGSEPGQAGASGRR